MQDARGTEIEPGVLVAYNLSGQVAIGRVKRASEGPRWDTIEIIPDQDWKKYSGTTSKIRSRFNLVVIDVDLVKLWLETLAEER